MDQKPQAPEVPAHGASSLDLPAAPKRGIDRRALLRGGAAAAPVLLTLHSGPVAASGSMTCTVASSFVSIATFASRNAGATSMQCSTMNANHWHTNARACATLAPAHRPAWAKLTVRGYLGRSSNALPGLSNQPDAYQLWEVMGLGTGPATSGELGVLHHILGLALSIDHGGNAVNTGGRINTAYLASIWQNYRTNGRYIASAGGLNWTDAQLISWLKLLQYPIPLPQA